MNAITDSGPLFRSIVGLTLRAAAANQAPSILDVTFARFGAWVEINSAWEGNFMESIAPGAFDATFAERGSHIRCLFDHGFDPMVGAKPLGVVTELKSTDIGPQGTVELFTDARYVQDLMPALKSKTLGSSYRFRVRSEKWDDAPEPSDHNPKGLPERTLLELDVFEFGPVPFPADEGTNSDDMLAVRSLTDRYTKDLAAVIGAKQDRKDHANPADEQPGVALTGSGADQQRSTAAMAAAIARRR